MLGVVGSNPTRSNEFRMTEQEIDDIIDRWHEGEWPGLELWERALGEIQLAAVVVMVSIPAR